MNTTLERAHIMEASRGGYSILAGSMGGLLLQLRYRDWLPLTTQTNIACWVGAIAVVLWMSLLSSAIGQSASAATLSEIKTVVVRVIVAPLSGVGDGASGTGFKVGPGLYVTNHHVVELASGDGYQIWLVPAVTGARPIVAHVRAQINDDLALLSADDIPGAAVTWDSTLPDGGSGVIALGYPGQIEALLGHNQLGEPSPPDVTVGTTINSALSQDDNGSMVTKLVHSASLWPGNSGGPLIDKCGRVVGVNTWLHSSDGLAQQNIAIAAGDVLRFLQDNQVPVVVDDRTCNDGVLSLASVSATPTPSLRTLPPVRHDNGGGLDGFEILLIVGVAVMALGGGVIALVARRERRGQSAVNSKRGSDW